MTAIPSTTLIQTDLWVYAFVFVVRMLGQLHRVDAGELAAQWVAYSHNKNGCEVLLETLDTFEREVRFECDILKCNHHDKYELI